jgi:hypothetical protein
MDLRIELELLLFTVVESPESVLLAGAPPGGAQVWLKGDDVTERGVLDLEDKSMGSPVFTGVELLDVLLSPDSLWSFLQDRSIGSSLESLALFKLTVTGLEEEYPEEEEEEDDEDEDDE